MTVVEMVGWHHHLNGYESEEILGVGDGQEVWGPAATGVSLASWLVMECSQTGHASGRLQTW